MTSLAHETNLSVMATGHSAHLMHFHTIDIMIYARATDCLLVKCSDHVTPAVINIYIYMSCVGSIA